MKDANPVYQIIAVRTAQASLLALAAHWTLHWPLTGPRALGLFLTPALCLYFAFVFVARWSWGLPILTRLPTPEQTVALTFDDGPSSETTPAVLDALRASDVRATFFVLGEAVDRSPDLLRRIISEGHAVGLHGYRHRPFVLLRHGQIRDEIQWTREAIRRACPDAAVSPWLRPPYGFKSPGVLWAAHRAGCRLAGWSGDGRDYDGRDYAEEDPARVTQNVLRRLRPGAIILLHDGPGNAATVAALPLLLRALSERGVRCVGLPEGLAEEPSGGHE